VTDKDTTAICTYINPLQKFIVDGVYDFDELVELPVQ
jgi:hypothetical protein